MCFLCAMHCGTTDQVDSASTVVRFVAQRVSSVSRQRAESSSLRLSPPVVCIYVLTEAASLRTEEQRSG